MTISVASMDRHVECCRTWRRGRVWSPWFAVAGQGVAWGFGSGKVNDHLSLVLAAIPDHLRTLACGHFFQLTEDHLDLGISTFHQNIDVAES